MGWSIKDLKNVAIWKKEAHLFRKRFLVNIHLLLQQRKRSSYYSLKGQRVAGFNSIFAVSSIPMAMKYYTEFKHQLAEQNRRFTVATIFSYAANEDDPDDALEEEGFDTDVLDQTSRDFLDGAIRDYNAAFGTNFDTSSDKFQNYY